MQDDIDKDEFNIILLKHHNLIKDCTFEEIPIKYKHQVAKHTTMLTGISLFNLMER